MTTDIRAESVALLAEALEAANLDPSIAMDDEGWPIIPDGDDRRMLLVSGASVLSASPTLARRLAFATAREMAEAECKRLGFKGPDLMHHEDHTGRLSWIADAGHAPDGAREWGDTPTDALLALAAKLREATR